MAAVLHVHVVPRARKTEIAGRHGDAIKIKLAAPPVDGAANDALVEFLADRLAVSRRGVRIAAGTSSRLKTIEIEGISVQDVERLADETLEGRNR